MSLSTKDFRWLHEEAWESAHLEFFERSRPSWEGYLARLMPSRHLRAHNAGRWVLVDGNDVPEAWADASRYPGNFTKFQLTFGNITTTEPHYAAAYLVSALFLGSDADLIAIVGIPHEALWPDESTRPDGRKTLVMTSSVYRDNGDAIRNLSLLHLEQHTWWQNKLANHSRPQLRYLISRRDRLEEKQQAKQKRRPRNVPLIARLFGFGRRS